jgi:hypothetical protein
MHNGTFATVGFGATILGKLTFPDSGIGVGSRQHSGHSAVDCYTLLAVIGSSKCLAKIRRTLWGA